MKIRNFIFAAIGFIMLAIGAIGLVIPILPTTPFVLLAAGCFSTTPAMHKRIMKIPFVREYIINYEQGIGLSAKTIAVSLTFLWGMLILSSAITRKPWLMAILAAIGIAVTVHIICVSKPRSKQTIKKHYYD